MGHFRRPLLDFTAGSLRLDLGLTSTQDASEQRKHSWNPTARPDQHRCVPDCGATSLEDEMLMTHLLVSACC